MSQSGPSSFKKLFSKKVDEEKVEEEILSMVEEGHEQGVIEETEVEMISNIFEFSDMDAKDIMTNRQKIIAMENTLLVDEALEFVLANSYSRYPVYEEDIDNIIGVIHLKDLVATYMNNPKTSITEVMEEPIFIHPTFNISKLLSKMQKEKIHMSVVVDEYGQTEGIVCMEDIIEEIVGNIFDEHDEEEEADIKRVNEDEYIVEGGASLKDLEDTIDVDFPDEDFETLNGFLLYKLGRLPMEDEKIKISYEGYDFIPLEICDKMITLVKIIKDKNYKDDEDKE
ncbi:MAG: HlyC/CorC family transporter [Lachnospiraceae bacterium]|nr:HlyC/CorC family transporter [Lachnospiraceae bacterium]